MTRYLLDTGAAGDWVSLREPLRHRVLAALRAGHRVGVCTPVLAELYAGAEMSRDPVDTHARIARSIDLLKEWPFDRAAAREFGRLRAVLRAIGRPMQLIDVQVAAVAFALGNTTVVTMDSDLSAIPGLSVEDWSKPETTP